jgi:hypothetical protein
MPDREACRRAAAECLEIANTTTDQDTRTRLTILAGDFLDMANGPRDDSAFRVLIDELNDFQMRK